MPLPFSAARRVAALALGAATMVSSALVIASVNSSSAGATTGADRFWAGTGYHGEFGAPSVLVENGRYYAYGTNLDGNTLPVLTSTDLRTWQARAAWPTGIYSSWSGFNDAYPGSSPRWSYRHKVADRYKAGTWAPSVAHVGNRYVDAYAVAVNARGRHCITLATSPSPLGPFRDTSTRPLVCSSDPGGTIDPQIFRPGNGRTYLLWKNAGRPGSRPTEFYVRQMNATATGLQPGTHAHLLLKTARPWEGNVIEAPAMIHYAGRYYLFYSGNRYTTSHYATGYAICRSVYGGCTRPVKTPLLHTDRNVAGPGAGTPFVGLGGHLRFAYSAWRTGHVGYPTSTACTHTKAGCNQRRLYVAMLGVGRAGRLRLVSDGA